MAPADINDRVEWREVTIGGDLFPTVRTGRVAAVEPSGLLTVEDDRGFLRDVDPNAAKVVGRYVGNGRTYPPTVWSNHVGPPTPTPTVADLIANVHAMRAAVGPPEPEQAIITPSLDALRASVPMMEMMSDRRRIFGLRVVVTKLADRPRLVPAAWVDATRGFAPAGWMPGDPGWLDAADAPHVVTAPGAEA